MNQKIKVLFIVPNLQGGGAERVMVHLVNHLDREHFTPLLALGKREGAYLSDVRDDVEIHSLGTLRARAALPAIIKLGRRLRPNVVLSTLGLNLATALARPFLPRGTRVLLREGNTLSAFLKEVGAHSRAQEMIYRCGYRMLYRLPHGIICQSDYMLSDLAATAHLPRRNLKRIYNPVDMAQIEALAAQGATPYDGPGPQILAIGRLSPQKGFDILLPAFAIVRQAHPTAVLTLLGDGEDKIALQDQARVLGIEDAVRFLGFQANPYLYLKHADIFVSSSRYEGFSNVIIEALACGTPVVATDCPGGNREVVQNGISGWLAPSEDGQALGTVLNCALTERGNFQASVLRDWCRERFSVDHITRLYETEFTAR